MKTIGLLMKVSVSVKYFLIFYILKLSKIARTMFISRKMCTKLSKSQSAKMFQMAAFNQK